MHVPTQHLSSAQGPGGSRASHKPAFSPNGTSISPQQNLSTRSHDGLETTTGVLTLLASTWIVAASAALPSPATPSTGRNPPWAEPLPWRIPVQPEAETPIRHMPQLHSAITNTHLPAAALGGDSARRLGCPRKRCRGCAVISVPEPPAPAAPRRQPRAPPRSLPPWEADTHVPY